MPTGHFTIGDLSFSFEGSLEELAHSQEIIREINQATYRLKRAADAEEVKIIYDQDLEGERGTFDKMRIRAYDDEHNYTLDLGVTDTNPLGIYVGYDQNIEVYNRDTGETWQITPEGETVGRSPKSGGSSQQNVQSSRHSGQSSQAELQSRQAPGGGRPPSQRGQALGPGPDRQANRKGAPSAASGGSNPTGSSSSAGSPSALEQSASGQQSTPDSLDTEEAMALLIRQISVYPDHELAGDTTVGEGEETLDTKIRGFARFCGRDGEYLRRVADVQGFEDAANLKVGEVEETLRLIQDEQSLQNKEDQQGDPR